MTTVAADLATASLSEVIAHLLETHHRYLDEAMPRLSLYLDHVLDAHGADHPELAQLKEVYERFRSEMETHLGREENVLFPMIQKIDRGEAGEAVHEFVPRPISVMLSDHGDAGRDLTSMRELTGGYVAPEDASDTYRAMLEAMRELEADTILHMEKEEQILFTRTLRRVGA